MKRLIFLPLYVFLLASCSIPNRITKVDNSNKKTKSFKLIQKPEAHSLGKNGPIEGRSYFNVSSTYLFKENINRHPEITVSFRILPKSRSNSLDSVMFYYLDGESIRLVSKYKRREGRFILPENLWVSFAHSKKIRCNFNAIKEGINIELNESETNKLAEFFQLAIERRDLQFLAIPVGKKKW